MLVHALDVVVVEVVLFEHFLDHVAGRLLHHAAEEFAVEAAPVDVADIALRALDGEVLAVGDLAADLHAAVAFAVLEADLEGQLEILVLLLAAQERVELQALGRRRADKGALLDAPVFQESFPAVEVLAVKEFALGGIVAMGRTSEPGRQTDEAKGEHPEVTHEKPPGVRG